MLYLNLSGDMEGVLKRLLWLAVFGLMVAQRSTAGAEDTNAITGETAQRSVVTEGAPDRSGETNLLTMNFRGAPLSLVLDYLSDAAGFIRLFALPSRVRALKDQEIGLAPTPPMSEPSVEPTLQIA